MRDVRKRQKQVLVAVDHLRDAARNLIEGIVDRLDIFWLNDFSFLPNS